MCLLACTDVRKQPGEVLYADRGAGAPGSGGQGGLFSLLVLSVSLLGSGTVPVCSSTPFPQLQEVVLKSSKVLRADVCVVGIGE